MIIALYNTLRRWGVLAPSPFRLEAMTVVTQAGGKRMVKRKFYTLEVFLAHYEGVITRYVKSHSAYWPLLLSVFSPASLPLFAAITFNDSDFFANASPAQDNVIFEHTAAGENRVLAVAGFVDNSRTVDSVVFSGDSMTEAEEQAWGNLSTKSVAGYYLANPDAGFASGTVTFSGVGANTSAAIVLSFTGCDLSAPLDTSGKNSGTNSSLTVSVTTTRANVMMVGMMGNDNATTAADPGSGVTETEDANTQSAIRTMGGYALAASAGSNSMSWSNGDAGSRWGGVVLAFAPSRFFSSPQIL